MAPALAAHAIDTAADAIVHVCPQGRIKTWNSGAAELFGIKASDACGNQLTESIIPEHVRHIRPLDPKPTPLGQANTRRAPALRADGSHFTLEFTVELLASEAGAPNMGSIVTMRDASAMGETVRKLRVRVAELESGMERLVVLARPPGMQDGGEAASSVARQRDVSDGVPIRSAAVDVDKRVEAMLSSQVQCVLATTADDLTPSTFLMAYAASPCLRTVIVATPLQARKAQQMLARSHVSLLWDNRTGNVADHGDGLLVTAAGQATVVPYDELPSTSARFLAQNPNMAAFLASEGVGLFSIRVRSYEVVEGYGRPQQWDPSRM